MAVDEPTWLDGRFKELGNAGYEQRMASCTLKVAQI
jgi:hypothetical protein